MNAKGKVFKYGDNVDTDVIIPARYLNIADPKELSTHAMEDIDADFVKNMHPGDIVEIPANVKHWHGAAADCWFSHLAFEFPGEETSNEWLESVDDEAFNALDNH